jgi:hypothetical protein
MTNMRVTQNGSSGAMAAWARKWALHRQLNSEGRAMFREHAALGVLNEAGRHDHSRHRKERRRAAAASGTAEVKARSRDWLAS